MTSSITFDYTDKIIVVEFDDGTVKVYTAAQKNQYISDFPDRQSDVIAIGW